MMKRVSVLFLVFVLAVTSVLCVPASADVDTISGETTEIKFLKGIGILDDAFDVNMPVTRGVYATYVARLFGDVPKSNAATTMYIDVKADSPECDGISLLTSLGLLAGYGDGTFRPERPVSLNEAAKVMVDLLGYKYRANLNGGYPTGYVITAQNLGLLKGLEAQQSYFYGSDFAMLLYNAIDVDIMMENGMIAGDGENSVTMETIEGHTILTENLDMYSGEGVIEANSVTNFSGMAVNDKQLILDGFAVTNDNAEYWNMVGCYVEYVYRQEENSNQKVLVYALPKEDSVLTLGKEDFLSLDGLRVEYIDENGKIKKVSLSGEVDFVYNGEVVVFDKKYIDDFKLGTIKLIENTGDNDYDIVMIENYTSFAVDSFNASQSKVDSDVKRGISLSLDADKYRVMHLLNADGAETSFENIGKGTVISYFVNDDYLKAYISKDMAEGVIDSISTANAIKTYEIRGNLYSEPEGYAGSTAEVGEGVTLYIDAFGYIADITLGFTDTLETGFLLKGARDDKGLSNQYGFKIYTAQDKVLTIYAADKIYYNGVSTKIEDLPDSLEQSVICYELNDEGKLITLETPVPRDDNYEDGRLMTIYPRTEGTPYYSSMLDSKVVFDSTTTMFAISIPDDGVITEGSISAITRNDLEDRQAYEFEGFAISAESSRLKALIKYGKIGTQMPRGENLATLVSLNCILDDNGMEVYKADVVVEGVEKTFYISDDVEGVAGPGDFAPGDCFCYDTNSDGEIDVVDRVYTVKDGWIPDDTAHYPVKNESGQPITDTVMHYGEVLDNDGAYLRLKFDDTPYSGYIQDYYAIPMSHYTAATVLTIGGRGCTVTSGKIQDVAKGDYVINYRNLMAAVGFVVIKHE